MIKKLKRLIISISVIIMCASPVAFGQTSMIMVKQDGLIGKVEDIINFLFGWIPLLIGGFLETIVKLGQQAFHPGSPFLFYFSNDNFFGMYTSATYPIFKIIAIIMLTPVIHMTGLSIMMPKKTAMQKRNATDKVQALLLGAFLIIFLPDILHFVIVLRDIVLSGLIDVFSGGQGSIVVAMKEIAMKGVVDGGLATFDFIDSSFYLGAVIFEIWLAITYIGMTFGFTILFLFSPIIAVKAPSNKGLEMIKDISKQMTGYLVTPLIDITLLGIVYKIRSLGDQLATFGVDEATWNFMSMAIILMVIPTRSQIKKTLGYGSAMADSLGAGLTMAATGMAMRSMRKGKGKTKNRDNKSEENEYSEQSEYYANRAENIKGSPSSEQQTTPNLSPLGSTVSGNSMPSTSRLNNETTTSPSMAEMNSTVGGSSEKLSDDQMDYYSKHVDKSYFNRRDHDISDDQMAQVYSKKAQMAKSARRNDSVKNGTAKVAKVAFGASGAMAGAFLGPSGMMLGGMLGAKGGDALNNSIHKTSDMIESGVEMTNRLSNKVKGPINDKLNMAYIKAFGDKSAFKDTQTDTQPNIDTGTETSNASYQSFSQPSQDSSEVANYVSKQERANVESFTLSLQGIKEESMKYQQNYTNEAHRINEENVAQAISSDGKNYNKHLTTGIENKEFIDSYKENMQKRVNEQADELAIIANKEMINGNEMQKKLKQAIQEVQDSNIQFQKEFENELRNRNISIDLDNIEYS